MLRLIGADEHIVANISDDFHRDIFMFRIGNGDKIRMISLKYFPADVAATAGGIAFAAKDCRCQKVRQRMLARAFRTANQIKMGNMPPAQAAC